MRIHSPPTKGLTMQNRWNRQKVYMIYMLYMVKEISFAITSGENVHNVPQ